jgi:ABC-type glycerol-3-phosphate transport system substrate-binding protein
MTDAAKLMTPQFTRETGINVILDEMDEVRMYEKIMAEHSAGIHNYDVIPMRDVDMLPYIDKGIIQPLDDLIYAKYLPVQGLDIDDYPKAYFDGQCRRYGKLYGIIFGSGSTDLAVRQDWFERDGIKIPTNMDELVAAAKHFTDPQKKIYGITFRGLKGHHATCSWYMGGRLPWGGNVFESSDGGVKPVVNSDVNIASLDFLCKLMPYAPPDIASFTHEESTTTFATGHAAMYIDATQLIPWIENPKVSVAAGNTKHCLIPKQFPDLKYWTALCGWTIGISAFTKNVEASMLFIEYMTSKRNAKVMVSLGATAERMSVLKDSDLVAKYPYFPDFLEIISHARYFHPLVVECNEVNYAIGTEVGNAYIGAKTAKQAFDDAQAELLKHTYHGMPDPPAR